MNFTARAVSWVTRRWVRNTRRKYCLPTVKRTASRSVFTSTSAARIFSIRRSETENHCFRSIAYYNGYMQDIIHADIFFFITSIAVVIFTIIAAIVGMYMIGIMRDVRQITRRVRDGV